MGDGKVRLTMAVQTEGIVLSNRRIKSIYYLLDLYCPSIADQAKPGQFVMVRTSEDYDPLLRRPFSIYRNYSTSYPSKDKRGHLSILYKKVGKGTQKMISFQKGQKVNLIGPLGNGFFIPPLPSPSPIILIGGGVGIASLSPLGRIFRHEQIYVFIGGKTKKDILCEKDFPKGNVFIATEDGSQGHTGTVVELFRSELKKFDKNLRHQVFVCGPEGMVKMLSRMNLPQKWTIQVSLEARMGCGFGACWGCVVKTKDPQMAYHRVCKDGPVFSLTEILWE